MPRFLASLELQLESLTLCQNNMDIIVAISSLFVFALTTFIVLLKMGDTTTQNEQHDIFKKHNKIADSLPATLDEFKRMSEDERRAALDAKDPRN